MNGRETKSRNSKILWIEDREGRNRDIFQRALGDRFSSWFEQHVVLATSLGETAAQMKTFRESKTPISGFIVDLRLNDKDLSPFGLADILTSDGRDAGFMFLLHCVRNFADRKDAPYANDYRMCPVLVLTAYSKPEFTNRFRNYIKAEAAKEGTGSTTWIVKPLYEEIAATEKPILEWFSKVQSERK
jgi:hypothetical protein